MAGGRIGYHAAKNRWGVAEMHDLIIRGATIYDGSGGPARHGDVAVSGGRIAAIGDGLGAARETVEADGLALAPGIIDTHTHYDAQITWDPWATPSPGLGVTTVVIGNCGFAIAPCRPPHRDMTARNLCNVEGMSIDALRAGVRWNFQTVPEYLDAVEDAGVGPNVAAYVGHSAVRTWVMGEAATERAATSEEVAEMAGIVREGMAAGAIGFATSTFEGHNGDGGVPMPSLCAEESEIGALVAAMAESGRGVFMLTRGGKTTIDALERIAADSGCPVIVAAILHDHTEPGRTDRAMAHIAEANARGRELYGQVSCCPLTMEFTLRNPYLMEGFAAWRPAMEARGDALEAVYRNPGFRAAIKAELENFEGLRAFSGDWSRIVVAEAKNGAAAVEGRTIAELAEASGAHPLDRFLDLGLADGLETMFTGTLLNSDEQAVGRLISHPNSTVALSDAGAHLTFFCDAGFGPHLYGHWVRDRGALSLEEAVHRMTGRQADIFRIRDRGRLAPGAWADLMLFDPDRIARTPNRRVHDLPGGASRLVCGAEGLHGVWINGARVADEGGFGGGANLPGRLIRAH